MGNTVNYLIQYGAYTLKEKPFNEVDNLILSQLSYLKFEGMVPGLLKRRKNMKFMELFCHPKREQLFLDERYEIPNRSLFEAVAFSRRFQNMKMNYFIDVVNTEEEMQFSAITFFLEDGTVYVAFRGTDETLIGWKEDFNMAFKAPIPSQLWSVNYLNQVGKKIGTPFMVGGHSKGGNLAVYSSVKCNHQVKQKISRIYTNDGPGFVGNIFSFEEFNLVKDKIYKIVPQSSLIGMLLKHREDYHVVASTGRGGMGQHDPFTWEIEEGRFVYRNDLSQGRKLLNERLNEWVESLDEKQRSIFVETLYQVISATEAETLLELTEEWKDNAIKMLNAIKDIDPETRKMIGKIITALFRIKTGKRKAKKEGIVKL
ncbi:MAG: Mbeg1-like protein [Acetivibrio sp.]